MAARLHFSLDGARGPFILIVCLLAGGCACTGPCSSSVLTPAGPIGAAERTILFDSLAIMLSIVVPTIVGALAFAWWFRASNKRAVYRPDWVYSGRIELLVWSVPALVIFFLGGVIWIGSHDLDPARPLGGRADAALEVQVVSLDWKWLFIYPTQAIATVNQLVVPAGVPVHFSLTSASVMNVFFVPQLGSMIYTMNGMITQLNLQSDRPAELYGESAQFSGDGFSDMHFTVHAVPGDAFNRWVAAVRSGTGPELGPGSYVELAQQSRHVRPYTYHKVADGLFTQVVAQQLAPGPGPQVGRGGPQVNPRTPPAGR